MKVNTAALLFSTVIFSLFLLLGISLIRTTNLLDREAKALAAAGEDTRMAEELKSRLLILNRNAFLHSLGRDRTRLEDSAALRTQISALLAGMEQLITNDEESIFMDLRTEISSYLEKMEGLENSGLPPLQRYVEVSKDVDETLVAIDRQIEVNRLQMETLVATIDRQNKMVDWLGLFLLAAGGAVLAILIGTMFLYIAHPLRIAAETIVKFGSGEAAARVSRRGLREIRQIGSSFNSMADRLQEKQKEQLRFIAAIAHDLRNPLNSMSMASELLVRKCDPENSRWADVILRQVKNLDRMVGDLLDTTRIESGHIDLRLSVHNVNALIEDSVRLHSAASRLHRFNVEIPDQSLLCRCDAGRIFQVINNLLSNAIKYSPNGGTVRIGARREQEEIVVSVSDEGIGIAPGDFDNIFTPFLRTSATRDTIPGIGLGLSASRHIIESHGGRMSVESEPGAGSTFYFTLPARTGETAAYAPPPQSPDETARGAVNDPRGSETRH
jgi:two-component system, OmpR family, sensor histidine kinase MtrB